MKKIILLLIISQFMQCKTEKKHYENPKSIKTNEEKFVVARSGLNFRDTPKGIIIGKLEFGEKVEIVKHTNILEKINDGNLQIKGEWVGINYKNEIFYVFDGYLKSKHEFSKIQQQKKHFKLITGTDSINYDLLKKLKSRNQFNFMNYLRSNEYSGGDTEGKIIERTFNNQTLAIDSSQTGEYGFSNTVFLFDKKGYINMINEHNFYIVYPEDPKSNKLTFLFEEVFLNFKTSPNYVFQRTDTLEKHFIEEYPRPMKKNFKKLPIDDYKLSYEYWIDQYNVAWNLGKEN